ncbi:hypothetical protein ONZ45_g17790 [Pleurotus djamor]|nr:hypothetical protein ONZ45_g17790 [Pleurotus djamor]
MQPPWPVSYKHEDRPENKAMITSSTHWSRMLKGTKSMDNLKHPTNLTPGRRNHPSRLAGSSASPYPTPQVPQNRHRPLPVQGPSHSASIDFSQTHYANRTPPLNSTNLTVSSSDPHPRPQSALGDHPTSPHRLQGRQMQSPTQTNEVPQDILRSPRAISPVRSYPSAGIYGTRTITQGDRGFSIPEAHRTPPRSPTSPRSPRYPNRHPGMDGTPSEHGSVSSDGSRTLIADYSRIANQYMNASMSESTLIPGRPRNDADVPTSPHPPSSPSDVSKLSTPVTPHNPDLDDSDSDAEGGTMWAKPPITNFLPDNGKTLLRPELKVQIENANGSVYPVSVPSTGSESSRSNLNSSKMSSAIPSISPSPKDVDRGSTFIDNRDYTWAPRPPPEDVYDHLEKFFPLHDLDKPVIEASSGGTSPTAPEYPPVPPLQVNHDRAKIRSKKSIRIVAEEHKKRIDPTFKWVRGELIGKGTYGRVYLAMNATTGEMMAVKQVEIPQTASDKNDTRQVTVVQALKLESETLKDLDHPNIVQYLGFEETPSNLSIFLEYVPGGSIGSCLLKHGKFDEEVTKSFTGQILAGLEYLHSKGILHRDMKADNILVEKSGICKISDFGISKRTDDMGGGAMTAMQGTVFWMAPEVIKTQKNGYNFKIDIWSVGCVVLEMWAGMRPWVGDEAVAVMFKLYQAQLPPPVPEDVVLSELADDFRRKCFAINPDERPTASELRKHKYLELAEGWTFNGFV